MLFITREKGLISGEDNGLPLFSILNFLENYIQTVILYPEIKFIAKKIWTSREKIGRKKTVNIRAKRKLNMGKKEKEIYKKCTCNKYNNIFDIKCKKICLTSDKVK